MTAHGLRTAASGRPARSLGMVLVFLMLLAPAFGQEADDLRGLLPPDELLRPESLMGALISLEVDRQIEEDGLVVELERLTKWRSRRDHALQILTGLYEEMDLTFNTGEGSDEPDEMELMEEDLRAAEAVVDMLAQEGRALRLRIEARRQRVKALTDRSEELLAAIPDDSDSLTGVWNVHLVPTDDSGVFTLYQSGTILSGEYVLNGGWHGSLQGTVVGGKVFLERIDAVKGRFSSMTGNLDAAGTGIRGTWKERDLTDNRASEGSWVANKRRRDGTQR